MSSQKWLARALFVLVIFAPGCMDPLDLCAPVTARVGFFSQGDCVLTRASFFRGHEWLTYFGNEYVEGSEQFTPDEVNAIAEGNRRVDYPKELMVHLENGVISYLDHLVRYTDQVEVQPFHFLLDNRNSTNEAAVLGREHIRDVTWRALSLWVDQRERALALLGQAHHSLQDSFSGAHTRRRFEPVDVDSDAACVGECGCIERVKAFMPRDEGFRAGVLFHGADGDDNIGHTTAEDSIYLPRNDCHNPARPADVERCLNPNAILAVEASSAHLAMVQRMIRRGSVGEAIDEDIALAAYAEFERQYLRLCDEDEEAEL